MEYTPVLTLIAGGLTGYFASLALQNVRQKHDITHRLLNEYFLVRKEIVDVVCNLITTSPVEEFSREEMLDYHRSITKLYFKHYDFLPAETIESLLLLIACLQDKKGNLYKLKNDTVLRLNNEEARSFIRDCCRYRNTRIFTNQALASENSRTRRNQAIHIHARNVMYKMNQVLTLKELTSLPEKLDKSR